MVKEIKYKKEEVEENEEEVNGLLYSINGLFYTEGDKPLTLLPCSKKSSHKLFKFAMEGEGGGSFAYR